uniref:Uncharacterized protein n=1 Tax=Junco hyemalis TaxID=40217 RepID=A0A8C5IN56_JUNHY
MTVTELGWQSCLAATRAVRSYASPNPGFQQQLQEYESTLLHEVRHPWVLWRGLQPGTAPLHQEGWESSLSLGKLRKELGMQQGEEEWEGRKALVRSFGMSGHPLPQEPCSRGRWKAEMEKSPIFSPK